MIPLPERLKVVQWIDEEVTEGARRHKACAEVGISIRTLQRWTRSGVVSADRRPEAIRPSPANRLTQEEREHILSVCNSAPYSSLPPSQIVPALADSGVYIASEASFYRVLHEHGQLNHRGRSQQRRKPAEPTTHTARKANEVWSWDISYCPSRVRGQFFYLYLVEDIYSRKIVSWEVHDSESGDIASRLIERAVLSEKCFRKPLILHSDNGSPMKSYTLRAKLEDLGISPSYSRPRVSNDNAFPESLFRTVKYCPQWPSQGFNDLVEAREWVKHFVRWYNQEHKHSGIRFVTPMQRHSGEDKAILDNRKRVYLQARKQNPRRWSGDIRNWTPAAKVTLNPRTKAEVLRAVA